MIGIRGHASTKKKKEEKPLAWDEYAAWKQIPASYRERVKAKWLEEWGEGNKDTIGDYVNNWLLNNRQDIKENFGETLEGKKHMRS